MKDKTLQALQAPWGVQYQQKSNSKQYVLSASVFSKEALFIIFFTVVWTGAFCFFLYDTIEGIFIQQLSGQWVRIIFFFSHGIPSVFLCWASINVIFGKITFTLDKKSLHYFRGVFGRGEVEEFLLKDITSITLEEEETAPLVITTEDRAIKIGKELPRERLVFLLQSLHLLLKKVEQDPLFLADDFSQHLIE